jgi:hypothetical protein
MTRLLAAVAAALLSGAEPTTKPDVCDFKSRDWSTMRGTLVKISRFRGKNDADIQKIAREALAGSDKFLIGEFEFQYASGKSGAAPPNDRVCYPKKVTFTATRNDGNDAAYECEATLDVKGAVK